jgi:aryl-alcohol dehydrogenase-like predicted oxidoreductase
MSPVLSSFKVNPVLDDNKSAAQRRERAASGEALPGGLYNRAAEVGCVEKRSLGQSGAFVSSVGLGGFELGHEQGEAPDVDRAVRVIETAIESGIDWLDTSENYHDTRNESLIGAALARVRGEIMVSSKASPEPALTGGGSGFRHDEIHAACRASLERLGRDHIDVYFLHFPDERGVPLEETWGAMAELADRGLVRAIGLSNYELADIERCHAQRPVDVVQDGLSLLELDLRGAIARCGVLGIGAVIYEPLASGILSDKTLEQLLAIWDGPWLESYFFDRLLAPGKGEQSMAVADAMRPLAARLGATVAQLAIAWVLHQPGVSAAIAGSRDGRHVAENAAASALDIRGSLAELEELIPLGPNVAAD